MTSFGVGLDPTAASLEETRAAARRADELGLDLIGIQDHPYVPRFLDALLLAGDLLARTERIHVFPDVANLPLRGAPMLAKQAASLDVLSGGRFELGIGAGARSEAIASMGGPERGPGEAIDALAEAIRLIRGFWAGEGTFEGAHYALRSVEPGPPPAHDIGIWLGVYKPRGLRLVGELGDGWVPSSPYAAPEQIPELARRIDEAAVADGRDPRQIRRIYNVIGDVSADELRRWRDELGFDTFLYWPRNDVVSEIERFAREVVPAVG